MDIANLIESVTGNAGVILVILGLVEYIRLMGVRDVLLRAASMLLGVVFGGGALIAEQGVPSDFSAWFFVLLAGILFGLIASGVVDLTGRLIAKNVAEATEDPEKVIVENE